MGFKPRLGRHLASLFGTTRLLGDHMALEVLPFCHMDGTWSLNRGLLLLSSDTVPQTGQREKEGLCAFVGILKNFSLYNFQINNNSFPFHQSLALRDIFPLAAGKVNLARGRNPPEKKGGSFISFSTTLPSLFCNRMTHQKVS